MRAAPARLEEEQASHVEVAALLAQFRNPAPSNITSSDNSSSSDEESGSDEEADDGEERKQREPVAAAYPWHSREAALEMNAFAAPRVPPAPPPHCDAARDFFRLYMPDEFLDFMVDQTNAFIEVERAEEKENQVRPSAAADNAVEDEAEAAPLTRRELEALLGCLIYMGVVCISDTRAYWAANTRQPFVADAFPRDRFLFLLSHLRVAAPDAVDPDTDPRLAKLGQLIDTINSNCTRHFYPGRELSLDEAMIAFKGRSIMRQHIAKKKSPTGFKVWMLVDCATNYVYNFDVFTGMKGRRREEGATVAVVLKLIRPLRTFRWHVLGMDGFFTSVSLFEQLLAKGFYGVGTTRHNRRHFPKELLQEVERCARGQWVWRQNGNLVVTSYMDKKPVNLLSTCCRPTERSSVERRSGNEVHEFPCPAVLPLYLRTMRGVDVFAQRQSYSKIGRRSRKWFYSIAWFLVDVAIHNAFILYQKKHNKRNFGEKDFRLELMKQLLGDFSARRAKGRAALSRKRPRDVPHSLQHSQARLTCRICTHRVGEGANNKKTQWICADCNLALCIPACYNTHIATLAEQERDREENE